MGKIKEDTGNQFTGMSGQFAVMSELTWRGYNVAIPQIDKGEDVYAVHPEQSHLWGCSPSDAHKTLDFDLAKADFRREFDDSAGKNGDRDGKTRLIPDYSRR